MNVLVTGGAGYIGSHTVVELLDAGYNAIVMDDLSNAKADVIDRIETITGKRPAFYKLDCKDKEGLRKVFSENQVDAIIHFAGFKAVGCVPKRHRGLGIPADSQIPGYGAAADGIGSHGQTAHSKPAESQAAHRQAAHCDAAQGQETHSHGCQAQQARTQHPQGNHPGG